MLSFFFFIDTATTEIYTLSLHDALPICSSCCCLVKGAGRNFKLTASAIAASRPERRSRRRDRKSTRLNSSHPSISYAVFCLKKKKKKYKPQQNAKTYKHSSIIAIQARRC